MGKCTPATLSSSSLTLNVACVTFSITDVLQKNATNEQSRKKK
jgi:hypothetical protein